MGPHRYAIGSTARRKDILDWLPFDHITFATLLPTPDAPKILMTYAFDEREDGGTHFEVRFAKPKPKDLPFYEHMWPNVQSKFDSAHCWRSRRGPRRRPTSRLSPFPVNGS